MHPKPRLECGRSCHYRYVRDAVANSDDKDVRKELLQLFSLHLRVALDDTMVDEPLLHL